MEVKENITLELNKSESSNLKLLIRDLEAQNYSKVGFNDKTISIKVNAETSDFITELNKKLNS